LNKRDLKKKERVMVLYHETRATTERDLGLNREDKTKKEVRLNLLLKRGVKIGAERRDVEKKIKTLKNCDQFWGKDRGKKEPSRWKKQREKKEGERNSDEIGGLGNEERAPERTRDDVKNQNSRKYILYLSGEGRGREQTGYQAVEIRNAKGTLARKHAISHFHRWRK